MSGLWLPLAAIVFAAALTYVCRIHTMRQAGGCCQPTAERTAQSVGEEIQRGREELTHLRERGARAEMYTGELDDGGAGRTPSRGPSGG